MKKILIVDDDIAVTNYLMVFLMQTELFEPTIVNDSREVPDLLQNETFDVMILDMDMPNVSGMDILKIMQSKDIQTPVVILTGVSDVDLAVRAMKRGAFDYLTKPVDDDLLLEVLNSAMEQSVIHRTIDQLPVELKREDLVHGAAFEQLPTQDPGMIRLFHQAEKVASSDLSVFIWGERGSGKEALARAIHKTSNRSEGPFVAVDAAAQDPEKFSADFFGQAKDWSGSKEERPGFLEAAAHGTLFLDEIDTLTLPMQVRLKRVIQTEEYYRENSTQIRQVDVRFIVASAHDLTSKEYKEKFSRDLLYHLMVNSIRIPSLRERTGDISLLAEHFLKKDIEKTGKKITGFKSDFIDLLMNYEFPDNVQELQTIIASAVVNEENGEISIDSLSPYIRERIQPWEEKPGLEGFKPRILRDVEFEHVSNTLKYFDEDLKKSANALGISIEKLEEILGLTRISHQDS